MSRYPVGQGGMVGTTSEVKMWWALGAAKVGAAMGVRWHRPCFVASWSLAVTQCRGHTLTHAASCTYTALTRTQEEATLLVQESEADARTLIGRNDSVDTSAHGPLVAPVVVQVRDALV